MNQNKAGVPLVPPLFPGRVRPRNVGTVVGATRLRVLGLLLTGKSPPPTVREIAAVVGVTYNNVRMDFQGLLAAGLVTLEPGRARTCVPCVRFVPLAELDREETPCP